MKKIIVLLPLVCSIVSSMEFRHSVIASPKSVQLSPVSVNHGNKVVDGTVKTSKLQDLGVEEDFSCIACLKKHKALIIGNASTNIKNITMTQISKLFDSMQQSIGTHFDSAIEFFESIPNKQLAYNSINGILEANINRDSKLEQIKALLIDGKSKGFMRKNDLGIENIFCYYSAFATLRNEKI